MVASSVEGAEDVTTHSIAAMSLQEEDYWSDYYYPTIEALQEHLVTHPILGKLEYDFSSTTDESISGSSNNSTELEEEEDDDEDDNDTQSEQLYVPENEEVLFSLEQLVNEFANGINGVTNLSEIARISLEFVNRVFPNISEDKGTALLETIIEIPITNTNEEHILTHLVVAITTSVYINQEYITDPAIQVAYYEVNYENTLKKVNDTTSIMFHENPDIHVQESLDRLISIINKLENNLNKAGNNPFLIVQAGSRALESCLPDMNKEEARMILEDLNNFDISQLGSKEVMSHLTASLALIIQNDAQYNIPADQVVQAYGITYNKMLNMLGESYYTKADASDV